MRVIYRKVRLAVREYWPFDAIAAGPSGSCRQGAATLSVSQFAALRLLAGGKLSSVQRREALP